VLAGLFCGGARQYDAERKRISIAIRIKFADTKSSPLVGSQVSDEDSVLKSVY
jgi:hypothetical protein